MGLVVVTLAALIQAGGWLLALGLLLDELVTSSPRVLVLVCVIVTFLGWATPKLGTASGGLITIGRW